MVVSAKVQALASQVQQAGQQQQVVQQLVQTLKATTPWYRDVEIAWHPNGQLHYVRYELNPAIRHSIIILSVGLVAWLAAPVVITSLTALIELCVVEMGFEVVAAIVAALVL